MSMLSVVIPSYNEQENIARTAAALAEILKRTDMDYELLFVDDGSKDETYACICAEAARDPRVKGIRFSRNFGKEASIFAGLRAAKGDCCVVIDCDLQHPPQVIPQMLALWRDGYEVVEGVKAGRGKEGLAYKLSAGLFYRMISRVTKIDMAASSDFKLLDRKAVDALAALQERSTLFRALSFWMGFRTARVEFTVAERAAGKSKWSFSSLLRYAVTNITSFTAVPLQIVTLLGVVMLAAFLVLGIQTLCRYLMGRAIEGFTTVILLLLIIGGSIMLSLGIIGHYVAKIYDEVKGRPQYIISETTTAGDGVRKDRG